MYRQNSGPRQIRSNVEARTISSPDNPIFKLAASLSHRKGREKTGLFMVEGFKLVIEALCSPGLVDTLIISDVVEEESLDESILKAGIPVVSISTRLSEKLTQTETTQGVWAICRQPHRGELAFSDLTGLILVLAGVQDPGNLGTMLRTAWAVGAQAVLLSTGSVDPYNPKVIRSAMGATFKLPIFTGISLQEIDSLRNSGFRVLVCDANGKTSLFQSDLRGKLAIVMGNEGRGLAVDWKSIADDSLSIPLQEGVDSLNVGVACGIVLYEAYRQRGIP